MRAVNINGSNYGGNKPEGHPFQADPIGILETATFTSDKNGNVTGTITNADSLLQPPQSFLDANHADNWVAKLTVSYDNLVLSDTTNDVSTSLEGVSATVVIDL